MLNERQIDSAVSIAVVMADPQRLRILDFVGRERQATPHTYAGLTGDPPGDVRAHFVTLAQAGCLKPADRGNFDDGDGHPYKLTPIGQQVLELAASF